LFWLLLCLLVVTSFSFSTSFKFPKGSRLRNQLVDFVCNL
jgi:hypothetical protein